MGLASTWRPGNLHPEESLPRPGNSPSCASGPAACGRSPCAALDGSHDPTQSLELSHSDVMRTGTVRAPVDCGYAALGRQRCRFFHLRISLDVPISGMTGEEGDRTTHLVKQCRVRVKITHSKAAGQRR